MIKVIIIDDQATSRDILKDILKTLPGVKLLAECTSVDEGKSAINSLHPDLIFLDVEMPVKNGFDLLKEISPIDFAVIFTTAYDKYAINAIKASALDYLLKPIEVQDVKEALQRFSEKNRDQSASQVALALEHLEKKVNLPDARIAIPLLNGIEFIKVSSILHVEANNSYSHLFLTDQSKLVVSKSIKEMEEILELYQFIRVHNSHLVNLSHIKKYQKGEGGIIVMDDGSEINVSRQRKDVLLNALKLRTD